MELVTTSLSLQPENLPPTERAIYYHALRVHLQVAQWKSLDINCLNPVEWGWQATDNGLEPIKTDLEAASNDVLQFIRCKCKLSSKNACGTRLCSCFKSGLKCVSACGDCRGESCENTVKMEDLDDEENLDRNIFDIFKT